MPTLEFKGKPFVYAHHLSVPFRELVIDADKSLPGPGGPSLDDNLIIHGDNLEALKALLPRYAGKVDVIYIDPPYNTGNEGWAYNDAVNSPLMKQWLGKTVDRDDLERHDKWLCMMWPRLQLLSELLADDGTFWMTIDDNEAHHARVVLDEVFGESNFIANFVWQSKDTPGNNSTGVAETHNHLFAYRKSDAALLSLQDRTDDQLANYTNPDKDPRGDWLAAPLTRAEFRERDFYPIPNKAGRMVKPPKGSSWRRPPAKMKWLHDDNRIWWGVAGDSEFPMEKKFLAEAKSGVVNQTWWPYEFAGSTRNAGAELKELFGGEKPFATPKPRKLIQRILEVVGNEAALVLDSFAGSATTAHAVLAANRIDNGSRKFILVETEPYANELTAERVRRAISGYEFTGNQREELLREPLSWAKFSSSAEMLARIDALENAHRNKFDSIAKAVSDGALVVTGIRASKEKADGLGGSFTFCTLGDSLDLEKFFDGETRPSWEQVARYVAFTATGETIGALPKEPPADWFVGEASGYRIHLLYKPDLAFMRSADAAISANLADSIAKANSRGKPVLLYAAAAFVSQKELGRRGITFCQLPYAIHRLLGDGPTGSAS